MAKSKKTRNTTLKNETLKLHVDDHIVLDNVWENASVPAIVVGFYPDGRPVVAIDNGAERGSSNLKNYQEGINADWSELYELPYDVEVANETNLFALSNNPDDKQFTRAEVFGLGLGDEIELGRTKNGSLIITNKEWDTTGKYPPVKAKVIGFKLNAKGNPTAPLLGIDRKTSKIKKSSAKWNYSKQDEIAWRFKEEWGEESGADVHSDQGFCYISAKTVFKKININKETHQGVGKMSNNTRPAFLDMVKTDAKDAGYRIAATQISKGTRTAILTLLEKQGGSSDGVKALGEMLDTEYGAAIISMAIGLGGTYLPVGAMKDPRIQRVCEELRINAMAGAGNKVVNELMEILMPVLMGALANLPEEKVAARIATSSSHQEEEEHTEETYQRKHV